MSYARGSSRLWRWEGKTRSGSLFRWEIFPPCGYRVKTPIPIFLIGPENWEASHVFNPNAFPVPVRNLVFSCMDCLSMFIFSVNQVEPNIERDRKQFLSKLRKNKAFYGFTPDPDKPCVVVYHNAKFLVALHLVLYSVKSFLDVYAQLVSKLIVSNSTIFGFNKGTVDGKQIEGGRLITWLTKSTPDTYTNASTLAHVIREHVFSWVKEAVNRRDKLIHHGEIPNLCPMMVPLYCEPHRVKANHVILPQMPNGVDVVTYCRETRNNLFQFIRETLVLLPDIDFSLVSLDEINE